MQRRLSLYFLPPSGTINTKAVNLFQDGYCLLTGRRLFNFVWAGGRQLKHVWTGRHLLTLVRAGRRLLDRVRVGHCLLTQTGRCLF